MKNFYNINIRLLATILSLFLSCICIFQVDVINNDGILYLRTAEAFQTGGFSLARSIYHWPLYSFLIYCTHKITYLSFEYSAYFLNTIFFAILTTCFVDIAQKLQFKKKYVLFSLLLFSFFPLINDYRNLIIRDAGFLSFYLLSLRSLIIYFQEENTKPVSQLFFWTFYTALSCLFRVEGFVYLFATPFFLFLIEINHKNNSKKILYFAIPILILFFLLGICIYFNYQYFLKNISRLQELYEKILMSYTAIHYTFYQKIPIIKNQILNLYSGSYSTLFLISGITAYYIVESIRAIGFFGFILIIIGGVKYRFNFKKQTVQLLLIYIFICFLTTYIFTLRYFFLSERYLLPMVITALFFAIPTLDFIEKKLLTLKKFPLILFKMGLFISILYLFLDSITHFGYSKIYVAHTQEWVQQHLSSQKSIYSNSRQIMYSAHINQDNWEQFTEDLSNVELLEKQKAQLESHDFLVLDIPKKDEEKTKDILKRLPIHLIKKFENERGDAVYIYKKNKNS